MFDLIPIDLIGDPMRQTMQEIQQPARLIFPSKSKIIVYRMLFSQFFFLKSQKFEIPDFYWLCAFVFFFHGSIINQLSYRIGYVTMQINIFFGRSINPLSFPLKTQSVSGMICICKHGKSGSSFAHFTEKNYTLSFSAQ